MPEQEFETGPAAVPGADVMPIGPADSTDNRLSPRLRSSRKPGVAVVVDVEGGEQWGTDTYSLTVNDSAGTVNQPVTIAPRDPLRRRLEITMDPASAGSLRIAGSADELKATGTRFVTLRAGSPPRVFGHQAAVLAVAVGGTVTFDVSTERKAYP